MVETRSHLNTAAESEEEWYCLRLGLTTAPGSPVQCRQLLTSYTALVEAVGGATSPALVDVELPRSIIDR